MNKQISILAGIAILALGLVVWLIQTPAKETFAQKPLFEELPTYANQLNSVQISNAQGVLLNAQMQDKTWIAKIYPEQPAYPISQSKLAGLVESLMTAKLVEAKTSNPNKHIYLGLQPIDAHDSMASLVTLKSADNVWQVLVGNKASLGEGHYVLKPNNAQSWRTDKAIDLPLDKFSWLKQPILPFQSKQINSIARVDNFAWQITQSEDGNWQLIDMPKNRQLKFDSILNSVVDNLTMLNFEQLVKSNQELTGMLNVLTRLEVILENASTFEVVVSEWDDRHYVNFISKQKSEYWQRWYYQVSQFSAQQLIKTVDDFLAEQADTTSDNESNPESIPEGESPL